MHRLRGAADEAVVARTREVSPCMLRTVYNNVLDMHIFRIVFVLYMQIVLIISSALYAKYPYRLVLYIL